MLLVDRKGSQKVRWLLFAAALLLLPVLPARRLHADSDPPETLTLSWEAPEGCPAREEALAAIVHLAGGRLGQGQRVRARVVIDRLPGGLWQADLLVSRENREARRILNEESCVALADAAAVIIALVMGSDPLPPMQPDSSSTAPNMDTGNAGPAGAGTSGPAGAGNAGSAGAGSSGPAGAVSAGPAGSASGGPPSAAPASSEAVSGNPIPPPSVGPALAPPASTLPGHDSWWKDARWGAGLGATGALGILPGLPIAPRLDLWIERSVLGLELSAGYFSSDQSVDTVSTAKFNLWVGAVRPCLAVAQGVVRASLCGGLELGQLVGVATTSQSIKSKPQQMVWFSISAGPELIWQVYGRWALLGSVAAEMAFSRPTFDIEGAEYRFQPELVGGQGRIGMRVAF